VFIKNTPEAHKAFGIKNAPTQNVFKKENLTGMLINDIDGLLGSSSLPISLNTKLSKAYDVNASIFEKGDGQSQLRYKPSYSVQQS
jgi:hypothetical protein